MDRTHQSRARRRAVPELERKNPERVLYRQRARAHHGRARGPYPQQLRRAQLRLRPDADWLAGAPRRARLPRDPPRRPAKPPGARRAWQRDRAILQPFDSAAAAAARPRAANRLGDRGFRRALQTPARGDVAAGMRGRSRYAARRRRGRNKIYHPGARAGRVSRRRRGAPRRRPLHLALGIAEPGGFSFRPRSFALGLFRPWPARRRRPGEFDRRGGGAGRAGRAS